jgi:hypothetical protein
MERYEAVPQRRNKHTHHPRVRGELPLTPAETGRKYHMLYSKAALRPVAGDDDLPGPGVIRARALHRGGGPHVKLHSLCVVFQPVAELHSNKSAADWGSMEITCGLTLRAGVYTGHVGGNLQNW